jgi:hypothetical protein
MIQKLQSKNCKSCAGQIPKHAAKCQHCGSFQNWRRHLDFGNTFLALLVALISVTGSTIPIVQKTLTPDDSKVSVRYIDRNDVSFPLIVTNDGDRPAVIDGGAGIKLEFINRQGVKSEHALLLGLDGGGRNSLIIPAKSSKFFYYFVRPNQGLDYIYPNMEKDWDRKHGGLVYLKKCKFFGSLINFQGSEEKYELTIYDANRPHKSMFGSNVMDEIFDASGVSIKIPNIDDMQKQRTQNSNPPLE